MPKCSFCKKVYEFPHGLTLVLNDGTVLYFCSSKCRKNFQMGRKSRKVKWVKKMKHTRDEEITEIKKEVEEKEAKEKAEEKPEKEKKEEKSEVKKEKEKKKEEKKEETKQEKAEEKEKEKAKEEK